MLALYGPLGRELGAKVKKIREAIGWGEIYAARMLGIRLKWLRRMEAGAIIATRELQRRMLRVYFKDEQWADHPTKPARADIAARATHRRVVSMKWYDEDLYQRLEHYALQHQYSMTAVVIAAVERFLLEEPALVTIKAAIDVAEKLRAESILAANPDLVFLLQADPLVAKLARQTKQVSADYASKLENWDPVWEGAADPVFAPGEGVLEPATSAIPDPEIL